MANTPPVGSIVGTGTPVSSGYPVFVSQDSNGTLVTPHGQYVWNPNAGSNGLWVPAPVDANGNPQHSLAGSYTKSVTLANAVTTVGVQSPVTVGGLKTLLIEVYGTATSFTVQIQGIGPSGTPYVLTAMNLTGLTTSQTISAAGLYQFDVTGLTSVEANVTAVAGGNVTVAGELVA
jgi:hypothetical protein